MATRKIADYTILREHGRGGMGTVYQALSPDGATVAVKTVYWPEKIDPRGRWEAIERFQREARAASSLSHPNICQVLDFGAEQDNLFIVMEFLEGNTVRQLIGDAGAIKVERAVEIVCGVGEALAHAHDQGIVHRDVKPENIMIMRGGQPKLMDFGLASVASETTLTSPDRLIGSLRYMSPEQVRGERVDARSDIFSLGATLYEMLTGRRAFSADDSAGVVHQILSSDPAPVAGLPARVGETLAKCLRKPPGERFGSAREVITSLTGEERAPIPEATLPLADLPIAGLDAELAALAEELARAGTSTDECDDPALVGEAGKISQFVRRMAWLLHTCVGSDLYLEPVWEAGQECALLRMRVGGELRELGRLPRALHEALVAAWKQQAGLAIEEHSQPQAGSARLAYQDILVALRISVVPTLYGERVAIRLVPTYSPSLAELGLANSSLKEWLSHSQGLVLITGPTGSGKGTTQAACVRELAERKLNIVAVGDPGEYLFPPGVAQLSVEESSRAEGIEALLEQGADVIVLGELRGNAELARSAAVAADMGHLVLSYQHGHDSISPLYDLLEWGVKRSLLVANLIGIANQRLLRRLCDACKKEQAPDQEVLAEIRESAEEGGYRIPESAVFYGPVGCDACQGKGYVGPVAVHECFSFSPALKAAFLRGAAPEEITKLAREQGQLSGFAAGVQKAVEGVTSLDEVMRKIPH